MKHFALLALFCCAAQAASFTYGDLDCLGTGCYGASSPTAGATLQGLAANVVTDAAGIYSHGFPFSPGAGEFTNTDRIFVGTVQTVFHDGYSSFGGRANGPQTFLLDYSGLVPSGHTILTLTLGIAADDFQRPVFGQPYTASVNGSTNTALTTKLNSLSQTGPVVHFFTIGIDTSQLVLSNQLTVSINQGGDGGDGWAVDFLTVGVTSELGVPEPASLVLFALGLAAVGWKRLRSA